MTLPTRFSGLRYWLDLGHPLFPERFYRKDGDVFGELNWLGRWSNAWRHHTRLLRPRWLRYAFARPMPRGWEPDHSCKDCGEIIG